MGADAEVSKYVRERTGFEDRGHKPLTQILSFCLTPLREKGQSANFLSLAVFLCSLGGSVQAELAFPLRILPNNLLPQFSLAIPKQCSEALTQGTTWGERWKK